MSRIYLGNLPMTADEAAVTAFLAEHGKRPTKVDLKKKAATGKSRGFAFVDFASDDEASAAIATLNGCEFAGRPVKASDAKVQTFASRDDDDMPMERRGGNRRGGSRRGR